MVESSASLRFSDSLSRFRDALSVCIRRQSVFVSKLSTRPSIWRSMFTLWMSAPLVLVRRQFVRMSRPSFFSSVRFNSPSPSPRQFNRLCMYTYRMWLFNKHSIYSYMYTVHLAVQLSTDSLDSLSEYQDVPSGCLNSLPTVFIFSGETACQTCLNCPFSSVVFYTVELSTIFLVNPSTSRYTSLTYSDVLYLGVNWRCNFVSCDRCYH